MPHYIVLSPSYWTTYPGSEYPPLEPPEEGRDCAFIANAKNAHEAKWAATRLWLEKNRRSWPQEQRDDGAHPLAGVSAERAPEIEDPAAWRPYFLDLALEES